jgi:hypothetical protein
LATQPQIITQFLVGANIDFAVDLWHNRHRALFLDLKATIDYAASGTPEDDGQKIAQSSLIASRSLGLGLRIF